jgi:hypothetical protein
VAVLLQYLGTTYKGLGMGNDDRIIEMHKTLGEVSADIKWIIRDRAEDMERIKQYKDNKRARITWTCAISIPIIFSLLLTGSMFAFGVIKNVDILTALHKPQMEIFQIGGKK